MLKARHLLIFAVMFALCGSTLFAQDAEDSGKKEKKEKKEKVVKEKKDKVILRDDYPYPSANSTEYKDFVSKKRHDQHDKYLDNKYEYPAFPKNQWEVGLDIGAMMISGDINAGRTSGFPIPGYMIGAHVRKSLGYIFSLRLSGFGGETQGYNWRGNSGWLSTEVFDVVNNPSLTGGVNSPSALQGGQNQAGSDNVYSQLNDEYDTPNYYAAGQGVVYYNYSTKIRNINIEGIVNLNNIRFHRRRNIVSAYGIFGVGNYIFSAKQDMLDGDGNEYDFASLGADYSIDANRKDIKKDLRDLLDGTFESQAMIATDDYWIFGALDKQDRAWQYRPELHFGLGLQFKVSKRFNIGWENRVFYSDEDLLDGQRFSDIDDSKDWDRYVTSNVSLNLNLGKKESFEPLWWMNPLDYSYGELNEPPCCDTWEFGDEDGDGVPDMFDEEPNSRKDCPVDTRGRELDSDGDGIKDCDDCQPFTPRHLIDKINDCGAAFDERKDTTIYITNTTVEYREPPKPSCEDTMLPNVLFDLNRYGVKPEFDAQLRTIANYLQSNPSVRLCVVGNTDNRGGNDYNDVLAWKRANEVKNTLISKFGVNPSQLAVQYSGENNPVVGGLSATGSKKGIDASHALNRRVDFKCCMDGQMDMGRPSGPDAGRK